MIRRWSRQPYLLARRLAVGVTLAEALTSGDAERRLNSFCNIVLTSLPIELPVTLASRRWQAAACGPGASRAKSLPQRLAVARFGIAKTVAEVDFLRQLFERTSRLGFLTLRIPAALSPTREVLVSLTPESDVADNLTRETKRLWTADGEAEPSLGDMPRACWHPVYGEDANLLHLARQLDIAGEATRVVCEGTPDPAANSLQPERYFAESITSETEFVLANGRSKTLRLPAGKYAYTLRSLPDDPEEWDDASQVKPHATGEIVWDAKRPRPVINAW